MLRLLIAFSGLLIGVILSYLAWDELEQRTYFVIAKHSILAILFLTVSYFLTSTALWMFMVLAVLLFALSLKFHHYFVEIAVYTLVTIPYFVYLTSPMARLLVASILFLYGLPAGTLLRKP